jgi:putative transposase
VPRNLKRYYGDGHLHFITCSCYQRRPLLDSPCRRDLFLCVLEDVRKRYQFLIVGYVVMPEHIHLLIGEPVVADPSVVMQALKISLVRRLALSRVDGQPVHFWQRRFYDFNVWGEKKRIEKLRYIHRNPVTRGLVQEPDQWAWSSFRSYLLHEPGRSVLIPNLAEYPLLAYCTTSLTSEGAPFLGFFARSGDSGEAWSRHSYPQASSCLGVSTIVPAGSRFLWPAAFGMTGVGWQ